MWTFTSRNVVRLRHNQTRIVPELIRSHQYWSGLNVRNSSSSTSAISTTPNLTSISTPILDEITSYSESVVEKEIGLDEFLSKGLESTNAHSKSSRKSTRPTSISMPRVNQVNEAQKSEQRLQRLATRSVPFREEVLSKGPGHKIWHQWYKGARKRSVHKIYEPTFLAIEASYDQRAIQLTVLAFEAFLKNNIDEAYAHWSKLFQYINKRADDNLQPLKAKSGSKPSSYGLLPRALVRLIPKLRKLELVQFDKFWAPVVVSPLAVEIIPIVLDLMCRHKQVDMAHHILHHIDDDIFLEATAKIDGRDQKTIYSHGINYGLNVILHKYSADKSVIGVSNNWREMFAIIDGLNTNIQIALLPSVAQHLAERIPSYSYGEFYKLLLTRRANLFNPKFNSFLKSLYASSDVGKQLIANTDEVVKRYEEEEDTWQGLEGNVDAGVDEKGQHEPTNRSTYDSKFYQYLLPQLSKHKDAQKTAWFLENIILKESNSTKNLEEALRFLIIRAVELDGMPAAYLIFETMLEKGIEPDLDLYRILFRGFRLHGQEMKCYDVVNQVLSNGYRLNGPMCLELLSLICSLYGPDTVLKYYQIIYPNNQQYLEELGIVDIIDKWKGRHHDFGINQTLNPLKFPLSSENIDPSVCNTDQSYALTILYKSICSQINTTEDITNLYENYRNAILTSKPSQKASIKIIDWLTSSLCQIRTHESINQAHAIFVDAVTNLPLSHSIKKNNSCVSPGLLGHLHCFPPGPGIGTDISKAIELVRVIQTNNYIPISRGLLTAIIKYYLKVQDREEAQKWYNCANRSGILITSPRIRNELND